MTIINTYNNSCKKTPFNRFTKLVNLGTPYLNDPTDYHRSSQQWHIQNKYALLKVCWSLKLIYITNQLSGPRVTWHRKTVLSHKSQAMILFRIPEWQRKPQHCRKLCCVGETNYVLGAVIMVNYRNRKLRLQVCHFGLNPKKRRLIKNLKATENGGPGSRFLVRNDVKQWN